MSKRSEITAVHVWYDAAAANDRDVDAYYSVSEVADDGDEIRCIGGSKTLSKAWSMGCERADDLGVECVEMSDESGRVTDRYTPAAEAESPMTPTQFTQETSMLYEDMTDEQLIAALPGAVSVSVNRDTGQMWIWAGYTERTEPGDGTVPCQILAHRGLLEHDTPEEGYHVFEVLGEHQEKFVAAGVR